MPIYEFACPACGNAFDLRFSTPQPVAAAACPACAEPAPRVLSTFAFRRGAAPSEQTPATPKRRAREPALCQQRPDVPLLCHMDRPSAERWIAKADGREEQYIEREERRTRAAEARGEPLATPAPAAAAPTTHHDHGQGAHAHI